MYRHRLRPPGGNRLALTGHAGVAGAIGNLFTKALGGLTLTLRGRTSVATTGEGIRSITTGRVFTVTPANIATTLASALPGDELLLEAGTYSGGLSIYQKANITFTGPADRSARITGDSGNNTVRISGSNGIVLRNVTIDSLGLGGDGIAAQSNFGPSYAITIDNCRIIGCDDTKDTSGISTHSSTVWDWTIKNCLFDGCGIGMYLGNSDGAAPFVRGIIEGNFFNATIGYNVQIKGQTVWGASVPGRPEGTTKTIIRNNVWWKSATNSGTGADERPLLNLGGHPAAGTGSTNTYEVYGNFFAGNPTAEPLLQCAGNCYIYNNVFYNVNGIVSGNYGAIYMQNWTSTGTPTLCPVKNVEVFSNTIVINAGTGVNIATATTGYTRRVTGNAIYAPTALSLGTAATQSNNTTGTFAAATAVMNKPDGGLGSTLDLHPQAGQLSGAGYSDAAWNTLTGYNTDFNAASRVFTVRGAYNTQGTNPGWFLQLNRKGDGISAPAPSSLTILYSSDEGVAVGPDTGSQYWQSAFKTNDGKMIDAMNSGHGIHTDNGLREFDPTAPLNARQTYVFAPHTYGTYAGNRPSLNPGGPSFPCGAIPYNQYDNHHYYYVPRLDSLVIPGMGVYKRSTGTWTHASRSELLNVVANVNYWNETGTATFISGLPWDTRELGWLNDQRVVDVNAGAVICAVGSAASNPYYYQTSFPGVYNPHQAWNANVDAGMVIGGGNSAGDDGGHVWFVIPGINVGVSNPYALIRKTAPLIGGIKPNKRWGRDGMCAVDSWMYWVGGGEDSGVASPHFWRINLAAHIQSNTESVSLSSGAGAIERLPDAPIDCGYLPLMKHDPYSNALVLISRGGIAMFDLRAWAWSTITPAEYVSYWNSPLTQKTPDGCVGDFINERLVGGVSTATLKKFYWRAGGGDTFLNNLPTGRATKERAFHSLKVLRPLDAASVLNVQTEDPTNPANTIGQNGIGPLRSIKHHAIIENFNDQYNPGAANRRITLFSGDWTDKWPSHNNRSDYPPIAAGYGFQNDDGRQEMWDADVSGIPAIGTDGNIRFKLANNFYHDYPWSGSTGYSGVGGFGGVEPQKGPYAPDGLGFVIDKRGDYWMGPCNVGYTPDFGAANGESFTNWDPIYKWNKPGVHTNGVRYGNGWTRPNQTRLRNRYASTGYDIGVPGENPGWGRPNTTAYDPVNDCLWVVAVNVGVSGGDASIGVVLYRFPCVPTGGTHTWERYPLTTVLAKNVGGPYETVTGHSLTGSGGDGDICNTVYCNGSIYFTHLHHFWVSPNANWQNLSGYWSDTWKNVARILRVQLNPGNFASSTVSWLPFPQAQNWWMRTWDGPNAAEAYAVGGYSGTPAQARSLKSVNNKLVMGPGPSSKVAVDPWISVYNTAGTPSAWVNSQPPASYPLTNGGHDWPKSLFSVVAMPSLDEVWLAGNVSDDISPGGAVDNFHIAHGMHRRNAYEAASGLFVGRRIIRLKV